ncbi:hypothetical protein D039_0945B, partial [Vibrio parahaemolyticus EKP-028]|jgi:cytochrome P450
VH